jgi:hypothetical protein
MAVLALEYVFQVFGNTPCIHVIYCDCDYVPGFYANTHFRDYIRRQLGVTRDRVNNVDYSLNVSCTRPAFGLCHTLSNGQSSALTHSRVPHLLQTLRAVSPRLRT